MLNQDDSTSQKPPEIWEFLSIGSQQALLLAERISVNMHLHENDEGAELLIRLLAGIAAACTETPKCHVHYITLRALTIFFAATQKSNDAFFDYIVHDLKIARDFRGEGGAQ